MQQQSVASTPSRCCETIFFSRCILLIGCVLIPALQGNAQVEHRLSWKPVRTIDVTAPEPTRLADREREFRERNSPAALEKLAKEVFGLLNPEYRSGDTTLDALYAAAFSKFNNHDYRGSIEACRDFYLARMTNGKAAGLDPSKRTFIEFFNEADLLMKDQILVAAFDEPMPKAVQLGGTDAILNYYNAGKHNAHMINVRMTIGTPGRINWVFQPDFITGPTVHLATGRSFLANAYNRDMFFTPLLASYVSTKDPRYLAKWADIMDDFLLNHRRDMAEAGLILDVGWGGAGGPNPAHLLYCLSHVPDAGKIFPASTFLRLLQNGWISSLPLQIRGTRVGGPNRIMHMYGFQLLQAYQASPELAEAGYLLRERRRCLEWYARACVNPDGTGIDYAPNYNKNYLIWPANDMRVYEKLKPVPEWFTPEWRTELAENQSSMARYLMRYFSPSGNEPGFKNPDRDLRSTYYGPKSLLRQVLPQLMEEPESKRLEAVFMPANPKGSKSPPRPDTQQPGFTSESYPYGGYYFLRENWSRESQFVYFNSYRPGASGNWRHNQNISLEAFGQTMLMFYRWESPLLVDGAGQIYASFFGAYPKSYRDDPNAVLYGKYGAHMAWLEPIKSRWHTSPRYDLAEGCVQMPYAEISTDKPTIFIDDVKHSRQVLFDRSAGVWIVTDLIRGGKAHSYHLQWCLKPDRSVPEGWSAKGKKIEDDADDKAEGKATVSKDPRGYAKDQIIIDPVAVTIKTLNPAVPNLSIYHAATTDLTLTPGAISQNTDKFGNAYMTGPEFKSMRDALVTTLLNPRPVSGPDLKDFTPFRQENTAGFDASTETGIILSYRASLTPAPLKSGVVSGDASTLMSTRTPGGQYSGIALDCRTFAINGKAIPSPSLDFEYVADTNGHVSFTPIYRPMDRVEILPATDAFIDQVEVSLTHNEMDTEIRYTLDGKDPSLESALYKAPFTLTATTWVKARAFRKGATRIPPTQDGTLASSTLAAFFRKLPVMPALKHPERQYTPGLSFEYFEDDWTISTLKLPLLRPITTGTARDLTDISALRSNSNSYAFVYHGYLEIPQTGVYTIHAPEEFVSSVANCGYDLRLFLDGTEWYPATRWHNFGNWSIPLEKGYHSLRMVYVDQRRGDYQASKEGYTGDRTWKGVGPRVTLSGPGLVQQTIPQTWLWH